MRDPAYLLDILQAAREIRELSNQLDRAKFARSKVEQFAVFHLFTVIGEAARRLSDTTKLAISDIPWQAMIGMRNHLVHGYDRIDIDLVWDTAIQDVPRLITRLEVIVSSDPSSEGTESKLE